MAITRMIVLVKLAVAVVLLAAGEHAGALTSGKHRRTVSAMPGK